MVDISWNVNRNYEISNHNYFILLRTDFIKVDKMRVFIVLASLIGLNLVTLIGFILIVVLYCKGRKTLEGKTKFLYIFINTTNFVIILSFFYLFIFLCYQHSQLSPNLVTFFQIKISNWAEMLWFHLRMLRMIKSWGMSNYKCQRFSSF